MYNIIFKVGVAKSQKICIIITRGGYMSFLEAYEEFKIYASKRHKNQGFVTLASDFKSKIVPYFSN